MEEVEYYPLSPVERGHLGSPVTLRRFSRATGTRTPGGPVYRAEASHSLGDS